MLGTTIEKGILSAASRQPPSKGSNMKNYHSTSTQAAPKPNRFPVPRPPGTAWTRRLHGFTLVELLVVITIIGILVGLTIPAVIYVRVIAKQAAVTLDLKQLEMACQAYKEKFGEYPPDFAGVYLSSPEGDAPRAAVMRHLAKAFPRYQPGIPAGLGNTGWQGFLDDVQAGWGINTGTGLTPATSLTFWLGGKPQWIDPSDSTKGIRGFSGFCANPANPFDISTSRIKPFYEFALTRLNLLSGGLVYWPQGAEGNKTTAPIVYFRAENGNYTRNGNPVDGSLSNVKNIDGSLCPAIDTRLSNINGLYNYDGSLPNPVYSWINPRSFQIFSSGLDVLYSSPQGSTLELGVCLAFPTGENYDPVGQTYDDITNFSDGTLENAMP